MRQLAVYFFALLIAGWGATQLEKRFQFSDLADPTLPASQGLLEHHKAFGTSLALEVTLVSAKLDLWSKPEAWQWLRDQVQNDRLARSEIESLSGPWQVPEFESGPDTFQIIPRRQAWPQASTHPLASFFGRLDQGVLKYQVLFSNSIEQPFEARSIIDYREQAERWAQELGLKFKTQVSVELTGPAAFSAASLKALRHDEMLNLSVLVLLPLLALMLWSSLRMGLVMLATMLVTGLATYGLMGWAGHPIDSLSAILFLVICFASLEDFVFLVHAGQRRGSIDASVFKTLYWPSFFTSLTTVIGFVSLMSSPIVMVQRFGLWAGVGAAIEWCVCFYMLPKLFEVFPALGNVNRSQTRAAKWLEALGRLHISKFGARALVLLPIVSLLFFHNLKTHNDPFEIFSKNHPINIDTNLQKNRDQWLARADLVSLGPVTQAEWTLAKHIALEALGQSSLDDEESFKKGLLVELGQMPEERQALVERLWTQSETRKTFASGSGTRRGTVYLTSLDATQLAAVNERLIERQSPARLTGAYNVYQEFSEMVLRTLESSAVITMLLVSVVILILALKFGLARQAPLLILSALWGPIVLLAGCALFGIQISVNLAPFAAVLMGLSGDNAIQYIFASRDGLTRALDERGGASVQSALMMAVIGAVPALSAFEPPKTLALFLVLGMMLGLLGDLILLRSLLPNRSKTAAPSPQG